ncbi:MAG: hydrogenase nickel incorporation protein HypB [Candidatus Acidiferrales bacterium]|jgi:hydrogenase nickel incorporation protein HypB
MREAVEKKVLGENDRVASALRLRFRERGILCVNLISSPGSGKTTLLERTLAALPRDSAVAVLTGDIQTDNDAQRLARFGFPVRQITTGGTCHLDARMIERALDALPLAESSLLFVENVGNLVCPASYDLGEAEKIVLLSVAEGEDKPLKYPGIFHRASLMVLTKTDLLPHVEFDAAAAKENARRIHPQIEIIELSCRTGDGFDQWVAWLGAKGRQYRAEIAAPAR